MAGARSRVRTTSRLEGWHRAVGARRRQSISACSARCRDTGNHRHECRGEDACSSPRAVLRAGNRACVFRFGSEFIARCRGERRVRRRGQRGNRRGNRILGWRNCFRRGDRNGWVRRYQAGRRPRYCPPRDNQKWSARFRPSLSILMLYESQLKRPQERHDCASTRRPVRQSN